MWQRVLAVRWSGKWQHQRALSGPRIVIGNGLMLVVDVLRMALCGGLVRRWLLIGFRVGVRRAQCWWGRLGEVRGSGMHVDGGHWDNAE